MSVVITGLGIVASNGVGKEQWWNNIVNDVSSFQVEENDLILGRVKKTDFSEYISPWASRKMDRMCLLSTVTSKMAIDDAALSLEQADVNRIGTIFSTFHGSFVTNKKEISNIIEKGMEHISPFWFPMTTFNAALGSVARTSKLKGVSTALIGSDSLFYAKMLLEDNQADAVILIYGDEIDELYVEAYNELGFLRYAQNKEIDNKIYGNNQGFIFSEGWGAVVLERKNFAINRGARIYGEIIDVRSLFDINIQPSFNTHIDISIKSYQQMITQLKSKIPHSEKGIICGIANGTNIDRKELDVLQKCFSNEDILLTSIKYYCGEALGVSPLFGIAASALVLEKGVVPSCGCTDSSWEKIARKNIMDNFGYGIVCSYLPNGLLSGYIITRT